MADTVTSTSVISLLILVSTLVLLLWRPRRVSVAWIAAAGGMFMLLLGPLRLSDVSPLARSTADVLIFLTGMMTLTGIAERAGVFSVLAEDFARLAGGSGIRLYALVFLLGALTTGLLPLDVTVIVLIPIVYAVTTKRRMDALPFMFACTFVANTSSLFLPVSNLTNLLLFNQLNLDFRDFITTMWLPGSVAVVTNFVVFLVVFRDRIPARFDEQIAMPVEAFDWWLDFTAATLIVTLCGILLLGFTQRPISIAAAAGAFLLVSVGVTSGRMETRLVLSSVDWSVLIFVVGMLLVVKGFEQGFLSSHVLAVPDSLTSGILWGVGSTTIGSNIVNNVPAALLAVPIIARSSGSARDGFTYGSLVGTNIGPTLTTYGSLATILWLSIVHKRGLDISTREYLRISILTTPLVLIATTAALWLSLR